MKPIVVWFIGFSGAGKTTLALRLSNHFVAQGIKVAVLDGDVVRAKKPKTGFGRAERIEHLRNVAQEAARLQKTNTVVLGAFITPYEEARSFLRTSCQNYIEIWVDTSLEDCEQRDVKGLYGKARRGEIAHFTGISDIFEEPLQSDIRVETAGRSVEETLQEILDKLTALAK